MQEVLTRLLEAEKEAEQLVAEARNKAVSIRSDAEARCNTRLREEREALRERTDRELSKTARREEERFRSELAALEERKRLLHADGGENLKAVIEKTKALLCESEIG